MFQSSTPRVQALGTLPLNGLLQQASFKSSLSLRHLRHPMFLHVPLSDDPVQWIRTSLQNNRHMSGHPRHQKEAITGIGRMRSKVVTTVSRCFRLPCLLRMKNSSSSTSTLEEGSPATCTGPQRVPGIHSLFLKGRGLHSTRNSDGHCQDTMT